MGLERGAVLRGLQQRLKFLVVRLLCGSMWFISLSHLRFGCSEVWLMLDFDPLNYKCSVKCFSSSWLTQLKMDFIGNVT